jgi:hypothetical protein
MGNVDDQLHALETGSIGPMGRVEQAGLLAHGLKTNPQGRRRGALFLLAALALVCLVVATGVLLSR